MPTRFLYHPRWTRLKLGKQPFVDSPKHLKLASFIKEDATIPSEFDWDKFNKADFPMSPFGNDVYSDCVFAGRANQTYRFEWTETGAVIKISDDSVINTYKRLTGTRRPGDKNDLGYVVASGLNDWRRNGWTLDDGNNYSISAFGKLPFLDHKLMRVGIYWFGGVQLGLQLPLSAREQFTRNQVWDVIKLRSPDNLKGSWGGHVVYLKGYDGNSVRAISWGQEVTITDAFLFNYADEAWAVIDNIDVWRQSPTVLEVGKLVQKLKDLGVRVEL